MPAIIRFLAYNPLPTSDPWGDRLVQGRTAQGLSQKESAHRIGVDPCTLARWERGEREPGGVFAARALRFVTTAEATWVPAAARTA
jgi:transcriptional regulator with XRE-family HTH domain